MNNPKLNKKQKWFLVLDAFLVILLVWGFYNTFIKKTDSLEWFIFGLFIFIIFNIVEFPRNKEGK